MNPDMNYSQRNTLVRTRELCMELHLLLDEVEHLREFLLAEQSMYAMRPGPLQGDEEFRGILRNQDYRYMQAMRDAEAYRIALDAVLPDTGVLLCQACELPYAQYSTNGSLLCDTCLDAVEPVAWVTANGRHLGDSMQDDLQNTDDGIVDYEDITTSISDIMSSEDYENMYDDSDFSYADEIDYIDTESDYSAMLAEEPFSAAAPAERRNHDVVPEDVSTIADQIAFTSSAARRLVHAVDDIVKQHNQANRRVAVQPSGGNAQNKSTTAQRGTHASNKILSKQPESRQNINLRNTADVSRNEPHSLAASDIAVDLLQQVDEPLTALPTPRATAAHPAASTAGDSDREDYVVYTGRGSVTSAAAEQESRESPTSSDRSGKGKASVMQVSAEQVEPLLPKKGRMRRGRRAKGDGRGVRANML